MSDMPDKPPDIDGKIREIRKRLRRIGLDPALHEDLIAIYGTAWSDWVIASTRIGTNNFLFKTPKGEVVPSPWFEIRKSAEETMARVGRQLGLTPDHAVTPTLPSWEDFTATLFEQ